MTIKELKDLIGKYPDDCRVRLCVDIHKEYWTYCEITAVDDSLLDQGVIHIEGIE